MRAEIDMSLIQLHHGYGCDFFSRNLPGILRPRALD